MMTSLASNDALPAREAFHQHRRNFAHPRCFIATLTKLVHPGYFIAHRDNLKQPMVAVNREEQAKTHRQTTQLNVVSKDGEQKHKDIPLAQWQAKVASKQPWWERVQMRDLLSNGAW